jgi:hypothetical protein
VTVFQNATLAGLSFNGSPGLIALSATGSVKTNAGGIIAPGDFPGITGTLKITGTPLVGPNATANFAGGRLQFDLGSTTIGGSQAAANLDLNDQINLTGNLALTSAQLEGSLLTGFTAAVNDLFFLIINDGTDAVAGTFAGLAQGATVTINGQGFANNFAVSYTGNSATNSFTGGNDVVLRAVTAIPEPGSVGLFAGAAGLAGLRRRHKNGA